ncbi:hypothetical protein AB0D59_08105 [Streptomyces sp. NPDC048417]|uniref:hypothetical protein n=1 Tax=Streptomyces sp. NPDC048417 TaxID=3155387 RepID=UPI00341F9E86
MLEGTVPVLFVLALLVFDWNRYFYGCQLGALGILVAVGQSVVPRPALRRPVLGWWWMRTCCRRRSWWAGSPPPGTVSSDLTANWSSSELVPHAWVLFLVVLSSRPRVAVETLAINVVTGLLFVLVWGYEDYAVLTARPPHVGDQYSGPGRPAPGREPLGGAHQARQARIRRHSEPVGNRLPVIRRRVDGRRQRPRLTAHPDLNRQKPLPTC